MLSNDEHIPTPSQISEQKENVCANMETQFYKAIFLKMKYILEIWYKKSVKELTHKLKKTH